MNTKPLNEMLSVKSSIERFIQGQVETYQVLHSQTYSNYSNSLFEEVERFVSSLFVSRQIDNNFVVKSVGHGDIEVIFTVGGHHSRVHYMLPHFVRWHIAEPVAPRAPQKVVKQEYECSVAPLSPPTGQIFKLQLPSFNVAPEITQAVTEMVRPFIYEPNDELTRSQLKTLIGDYLHGLVAKREIQTFTVVCDPSNNPSSVIEMNGLRVDVFIENRFGEDRIHIPVTIHQDAQLEVIRQTVVANPRTLQAEWTIEPIQDLVIEGDLTQLISESAYDQAMKGLT